MVKINCPFCFLNCSLIIKKEKFKFAIEYEEPLCARGNAIPILLDSPKRLAEPIFINNGKKEKIGWKKVFEELIKDLKTYKKEEIAVGLDTSLKEEEKRKIYNFFKSLGIENIFSGYLEPDQFFFFKVNGVKEGDLEDIDKADFILLIGDVFGSFPIVARRILKRKYEDKNVLLYGIDIFKNRASGFTNQFLTPKIGTEPFLLFLISEKAQIIKSKGIKIEEVEKLCEINPVLIELYSEKILNAKRGILIMSLESGKSFEPILYSLLAQILCNKKTNLYFLGLKNSSYIPFDIKFGELLEKIEERKIKLLINFGNSFPFLYPPIYEKLKNCEKVYLTNFYQMPIDDLNNTYLLPQSLPIEDKNLISPYSGSKTLSEILEEINFNINLYISQFNYPKEKIYKEKDVLERFNEYLSFYKENLKEKLENNLVIIGKKEPFYFLNIFERDSYLYLNNEKEIAISLPKKIKKELPENIGILELENLENRKYFPIFVDKREKFIIIKPLIIEWKKGDI
ncbi:MAG: hypothetical protein N2323_05255 [candidate division WOR-3 bacterium]|nr:hypothetical protein [candidate division WOR-3 bacterium]